MKKSLLLLSLTSALLMAGTKGEVEVYTKPNIDTLNVEKSNLESGIKTKVGLENTGFEFGGELVNKLDDNSINLFIIRDPKSLLTTTGKVWAEYKNDTLVKNLDLRLKTTFDTDLKLEKEFELGYTHNKLRVSNLAKFNSRLFFKAPKLEDTIKLEYGKYSFIDKSTLKLFLGNDFSKTNAGFTTVGLKLSGEMNSPVKITANAQIRYNFNSDELEAKYGTGYREDMFKNMLSSAGFVHAYDISVNYDLKDVNLYGDLGLAHLHYKVEKSSINLVGITSLVGVKYTGINNLNLDFSLNNKTYIKEGAGSVIKFLVKGDYTHQINKLTIKPKVETSLEYNVNPSHLNYLFKPGIEMTYNIINNLNLKAEIADELNVGVNFGGKQTEKTVTNNLKGELSLKYTW